MKTTFDLPVELVRRLKLRAVHDGRKLKEVAADILRAGLAANAPNATGEPAVVTRNKRTGTPVIQCRRAAPRGQDRPPEPAARGKPVIFIMANINAGEVEGKEGSLHLARRLLSGNLRPLLDQLVILIAPDYNADGNERISTDNRVAQNGPIGGVGIRE